MAIPRQVLPVGFHMLTWRCVNRMFLQRPDEQRNAAFEGGHAVAGQPLLRCDVANFLLGTVAMCALIGPMREPNGPPLLKVFAAFDETS